MVATDYPRGILSKSDRKYLLGDSDIEPKSQSERNARSRIRDRLRAALRDFELLSDPGRFPDRDLDQIRYTEIPVSREKGTEPEELLDPLVRDGLINMAAFIYRVNPNPEAYEAITGEGKAEAQRLLAQNREDLVETLEEKLDAEEPLADKEYTHLLVHSDRPADEIRAHARKHATEEKSAEEQFNEAVDELADKYGHGSDGE